MHKYQINCFKTDLLIVVKWVNEIIINQSRSCDGFCDYDSTWPCTSCSSEYWQLLPHTTSRFITPSLRAFRFLSTLQASLRFPSISIAFFSSHLHLSGSACDTCFCECCNQASSFHLHLFLLFLRIFIADTSGKLMIVWMISFSFCSLPHIFCFFLPFL